MLNLFLREAGKAAVRNRLRSFLTALGITIGIAAVVCVVAIGQAGQARSEEQLKGLGDNLVWIEAGSRTANGVRTGSHTTTTLVAEDGEAILAQVSLVKSCSPQVDGNVQAVRGNRNWQTKYRGVSPDYLDIRRWTVARGDPFSDEDVKHVNSVILIGDTVREQLFGTENPLGEEVRIATHVFRVIGVLGQKGQSATGQDQDDAVFLPYTTAQKKLRGKGIAWLDDLMCSAVTAAAVRPAIDDVSSLMRQRHRIRLGADDDFNIRKPEEIVKAQMETAATLALLLIAIASISLLVGGIGIMNVMLVSVAERTREIGLRLAVGASQGAVQLQFLGEAVLLSLAGGLGGVGLGILASYVFGRALSWPMTIPALALALAPLFSIAVGVFFGFYPAFLAARLDPIDALRHE
jgi:putative ABC transport system permease protein